MARKKEQEQLEQLRSRYGKVALVGEQSGWHVQYIKVTPSGSVNEPYRQEWQALTGICSTPQAAVAMALKTEVGNAV